MLELAAALRSADRSGLVADMVVAVSRRALNGTCPCGAARRPRPGRAAPPAAVHLGPQAPGARCAADSERLRQQHTLFTYEDLELSTARCSDRHRRSCGALVRCT